MENNLEIKKCITDFDSMNYDEITSMSKKELKKALDIGETKNAKLLQLISKKQNITSNLNKYRKEFILSLKDSTSDSVGIKISILTYEKELEIVDDLLQRLFPDFNTNLSKK